MKTINAITKAMKTLALLFFVWIAHSVSADTIDFYHVYYNDVMIKQYNLHHIGKHNIIVLDSSKIKETDSLKVSYWYDTPCFEWTCHLNIYNTDSNIIISTDNKGTGKYLSISLNDLLQNNRQHKKKGYRFEYYDDQYSNKRNLFYLKLE